ncbi:MAG: glycogen debranching N-terminal domain-containing protein [Acidimicrobiia bacterium]
MASPWSTSGSASLGVGGFVTLVEGSSFSISGMSGDIIPGLPHGLFIQDTRFLSRIAMRVNGERVEPLAAESQEPFVGVFVARSVPNPGRADSQFLVVRTRYVGNGMREDIEVRNFGEEAAFCDLELLFEADFADLFEVKEARVEKRGPVELADYDNGITFTYRNGRGSRATIVEFDRPARIRGAMATFAVVVPPGESWILSTEVRGVVDDVEIEPLYRSGQPVARSQPSARLTEWRRKLPRFDTEHEPVKLLLQRSCDDLAALRIFDPAHPDRTVVAAGAPWFMTIFGRDSLIASWMAMMIDSDLALGTLETLASVQGTKVDPDTEEEPGRILHEVRFGEAARQSLGGQSRYYGTADATPLFVMMVGELSRWGNKREQVDALLPAADGALDWVRNYGDRDGDGYVEYQRYTDRGLRNQGWKDSFDAVRFSDGRLAEPPIALAEVQGYVYAALIARAHCASERGDRPLAEQLRTEAATLKANFNRDFWIEEKAYYAMALDRDKKPVDAVTSNIGHCLWTGIIDEEKAHLVAKHLMSEAMFTGWGVRTLADSMRGFNPLSYHNGSVWPHDNAIAAAGLMRYGFVHEAARLIEAQLAAAEHFEWRLPELFAGLPRDGFPFPVRYPTACSPQAWAAGSPLLILRTLLRFEPDLRNGNLHIAPILPEWMGRLRVDKIPLLAGHLSIEVEDDRLQVLEAPEGVDIVSEPRRATT